jgi:uncharacterized protein
MSKAAFGSVLRDDFTPSSDVDVLVEFEPGKTPGFAFFSMEEELSRILGRRVDLNTPNSLSKYFRDEVLAEAEELYVQARWLRADAPYARSCARGRRHR